MTTYDKRHSLSMIASAAVSGARLVNRHGAHASTSADVFGISEGGAPLGRAFSAITTFSGLVEAAEAIPDGSPVKPAADGTGRAAVGTDADSCGWAVYGAIKAGAMASVHVVEGRGGLSGAGKRSYSAQIISGDSRAANGQMPTTAFGWNRLTRNIFRASDGLVYMTATAGHGLTNGAWVYFHNLGKSNYELNNIQLQVATLTAVPDDVVAYVAADGGAATTANTVLLVDAPGGNVNSVAANAGNYTLEMVFGMGGATSWANAYMGHRFKKNINIAKGGATLANWLEDVPTIINHPVLPKHSYTDILTNDWSGLADSQSAVDTLIGQYKDGITKILNAGMFHTVPNLIPVGTMSPTQLKNMNRFNRGIANELWTMDGVIGANYYGEIVVTSTGLGNVAYFFGDQFHTRGSGNARLGKVAAAAILARMPLPPRVASSAPSPTNALTNPWMTGTTGTASTAGSAAAPSANTGVATGWSIAAYYNSAVSGVNWTTILPWLQDSTPTVWPANVAVALWKTVTSAAKDFCYVATVAGNTHASTEPTWPTTLFQTVVDNGVTWMCVPYVNDGTLARIQFLRGVTGAGMTNNSWIRIQQTGLTLASLAGTDAAIAVGDKITLGGIVRIFKNPAAPGIQGVNLQIRGESTNDGNFAVGRDLAKSDFLDATTDAVLYPVEWTLETNPDFRLPNGQAALTSVLELVIGASAEVIVGFSHPSLTKAA